MKNLWKVLPPLLADTFGVTDVIDRGDGLLVIDDSAGYRGNMGSMRPARSVCSNIRIEDVINGTRKKILQAWNESGAKYHPSYVLLSAAPASSMIGTDLDEAAEAISKLSNLPAAALKTSGHKVYDYGISATEKAIAELLLEKQESHFDCFNVVGENTIDRSEENLEALDQWLKENGAAHGLSLAVNWGKNNSSESLKRSAEAKINLVTTVAGLGAAEAMKKKLGIPYVAGVPFGKSWSKLVLESLQSGQTPILEEQAGQSGLIVYEQFAANAIRATLQLDFNQPGIVCASFGTMDKKYMQKKDKRLKWEEDLTKLIAESSFEWIIGDPLVEPLVPDTVRFIPLSSKIFITASNEPTPDLCGENLNRWLSKNFIERV